MKSNPPRWAERILEWYCNPYLLEEIQGDANELYQQRLLNEGKRRADLRYIWDVVRFCRWSNIRRDAQRQSLAAMLAIMQFSLKITIRNAQSKKAMFAFKIFGLAVSLAFSLVLLVYVIQELETDKFHANHERIYRVTSKVKFADHTTHYAVTPYPLGETLAQRIPEVAHYTRFSYEESPLFQVNDNYYADLRVFIADSNFLKTFTFNIVSGASNPLKGTNRVVLTKSLAQRWFADEDPIGKTLIYGNDIQLEVATIIDDPPPGSHLQFDALIAWNTLEHYDDWGNLNAYTYVVLKPGSAIKDVESRMQPVIESFHDQIARQYNASFEPHFQNIKDIHFSSFMDEDVAQKRSQHEIFIIGVVVILLLLGGLINYLNISLAQFTTQLRRVKIQRIFGGSSGSRAKSTILETLFNLMITLPIVVLLMVVCQGLIEKELSLKLDFSTLQSSLFLSVAAAFLMAFFLSSVLNTFFLSKAEWFVTGEKEASSGKSGGAGIRTLLVAAQIAFSVVMIALMNIISDQLQFIRSSANGFEDSNTMIIKIRDPDPARIESFMEGARGYSGVINLEQSSYYPGQVESKWVFEVETDQGMKQMLLPLMRCGEAYFETLDIPLKKGRRFNKGEDDNHSAFLINETAARTFHWKDPLGKRIRGPISGQDEAYKDGKVIGVLSDFHFTSLHGRIEPLIIFLTDDNWAGNYIYVKLQKSKTKQLVAAIDDVFKNHWPESPFEYEFLDSKYAGLYRSDEQLKEIFEVAWIISILLSSLGIFSISALLVSNKLREIGVRKVFGAEWFDLLLLHWRNFVRILLFSILLAGPAIWFLGSEWLENYAYHIHVGTNHFIVPIIASILITFLVSVYHSIKASRIEPIKILKHE